MVPSAFTPPSFASLIVVTTPSFSATAGTGTALSSTAAASEPIKAVIALLASFIEALNISGSTVLSAVIVKLIVFEVPTYVLSAFLI